MLALLVTLLNIMVGWAYIWASSFCLWVCRWAVTYHTDKFEQFDELGRVPARSCMLQQPRRYTARSGFQSGLICSRLTVFGETWHEVPKWSKKQFYKHNQTAHEVLFSDGKDHQRFGFVSSSARPKRTESKPEFDCLGDSKALEKTGVDER